MNYFVTGTDTGIGKTFVVSLILRALRKSGRDSVGMKPICCGDRADAEALFEASGKSVPIDDINPVWLRTEAAPYVAAAIEDHPIDLGLIRQSFSRLRHSHSSLLVEGVGGWLVPIKKGYWVSDLAAEFALPVIVVAPNRLGALNHTALTVRSVQGAGLTCAGVILNNFDSPDDIAATTNGRIIEELIGVPLLFEIRPGEQQLPPGVCNDLGHCF